MSDYKPLGVCTKCEYKSKIGDKTTYSWGGHHYCKKCIKEIEPEDKKK